MRRWMLLAMVLSVPLSAAADGGVQVTGAWIRQPPPGTDVAAAYMELQSTSPAALVGISTPWAKSAELHHGEHVGDVVRMRPVKRIDLPPGTRVLLAPGGDHVMLIDLKRTLRPGDHVPLNLAVDGPGRITVRVDALVKPLVDGEPHRH